MSNPSSDMTEGTLRQRRNLMVTSVIIIVFFKADIQLGSQLTILGAAVTVGEPSALLHLLLIAHCYYWFRYYQYVQADPFYQSEKVRYKSLVNKKEERMLSEKAIEAAGVGTAYPPYRGDFEFVDGNRLKGIVKLPATEAGVRKDIEVPVEFDGSFLGQMFHWKIAYDVFVKGKLVTDFLLPTLLAGGSLMALLAKLLFT